MIANHAAIPGRAPTAHKSQRRTEGPKATAIGMASMKLLGLTRKATAKAMPAASAQPARFRLFHAARTAARDHAVAGTSLSAWSDV